MAEATTPLVLPVAPPAASILPPDTRAFARMRVRTARNLLVQLCAQAKFRLGLVLALSGLLWLGLFWVCVDGFHFLRVTIVQRELYEQTVRMLFGMFFASLMVMFLFSSAIILYGLLFCTREAAFLLTLPARAEQVFLHKFQESLLLTGWGFVLLGSPLLLAFGLIADAPWYYFALLLPYMLAFVYIPSAIGAIACLWIVYRLPTRRLLAAMLAGAALLAGAVTLGWSLWTVPDSALLNARWFQETLGRLQFTQQRLLPSWWLGSGLLDAARGGRTDAVMFLAVLASNAMFLRQVAVWSAARVYRRAYDAVFSLPSRPRRAQTALLDRLLQASLRPLPPTLRLLLVKDLRLFRRDPVQWSQFLVFFGLLGLYFLNIRRFTYDLNYAGWINMVSFLNLTVVGLLLSTFNTRFIFPMVSLEGRRFWVLGLLPVRRDTILWGKFLFAVLGSLVPSCLLILISDAMLRVSPWIIASHQVTCVLLSVGLAGVAVGLGARLPRLRELSPSRIAAGFGGTLNLVVSTIYILLIVLFTALPCHFYLALPDKAGISGYDVSLHGYFLRWLLLGSAASVALTVLVAAVPLRLGFRAFRRMEF